MALKAAGSPPEGERSKSKSVVLKEYQRALTRFSYLGIFAGVALAITLYCGLWIDGRFDSSPLGLIIGLLVGFIAIIREVFRAVIAAKKRSHSTIGETDEKQDTTSEDER
jgi:F0F1-type ATP synthase assembly protein I